MGEVTTLFKNSKSNENEGDKKMEEAKKFHIMIDIETLGIQSNSAILSIGAATFLEGETELKSLFYAEVNIDEQIDSGLYGVTAGTIRFWLEQAMIPSNGKSSSVDIFDPSTPKHRLFEALGALTAYINGYENATIWANHPSFDISILENAFRTEEFPIPWKHFQVQDYSTLKNSYKMVPKPPVRGVAHNAVEDAIFQAHHLIELLKFQEIAIGSVTVLPETPLH